MAIIQGLTKDRMLEIEAAAIVSGVVNSQSHLILTKHDGTTIDTGYLIVNGVDSIRQTVKNTTGSTITKGSAVYISGATGDNVLITKAQANTEATSSKTLGLVFSDIVTNGYGQVITEGILTGIDTSSSVAGDPVWLSPTTSGGLVYGNGIANKPKAPNHLVFIGIVVRSHSINGAIQVKIQNGFELEELHNVNIISPADNDLLAYDTTTGTWINQSAYEAGVGSYIDTLDAMTRANDAYSYADAASQIANAAYGYAGTKAPIDNAVFTGTTVIPNARIVDQYLNQGAPIAKTAAYTLLVSDLLTGLITTAGTATFALTLPTGTLTDAGILSGSMGVNDSFDWFVVNTVAFTVTITAATAHTYVGNATIAVNSSAQFRTRKTAANTFITYRLG